MDRSTQPSNKYMATIAKAAISVALLATIAAQLDFHSFVSHWRRLDQSVMVTVLALVALQTTVISGMRLKLLLDSIGIQQPLVRTSQVELCGFFFEQVALGFVGGDAMRLWLLHRTQIPLRDAFKALFFDRCLGFGALLLLVVAGLPGLAKLVPGLVDRISSVLLWAAIFAGGAIALIVLLLVLRKYRRHPLLAEVAGLVQASIREPRVRHRLIVVLTLAVVTHLLNVLIFHLVGQNLGLPLSLENWFSFVPAALLLSMIPVSVGGWGVREGIFLFGLGTLGVAPENATAASILFGLGVLVVTLPGGLVWLLNRK